MKGLVPNVPDPTCFLPRDAREDQGGGLNGLNDLNVLNSTMLGYSLSDTLSRGLPRGMNNGD
jgi:hypothetical protein